ncbi:MAG: DUF1343 domain-containing protein [Halobacteriovoraceae bacterium]|nr:DUF1343 domain-containing protein [Halobacteriovoraceae bacterium]MCB9095137.1 DUF1343 domain-containing protein [Halobacteriovoraceae bacterium]
MLKIFLFTGVFLSFSLWAQVNVEQGVDRWNEWVPTLKNQSVAVLAHHASQTQMGEHLIDILMREGVDLKKIFVPEHGLRDLEDDWITDGIDPISKVPITSLYKPNKKFPAPEDLKGIDTLIIDLKDVGVRYYTYNTTIYLTIKSAIENSLRVILLDRINPLGGNASGLLLDATLANKFYAYFEIPAVHSLTSAELMNYLFAHHPQRGNLEFIQNQNWDHSLTWSDTTLPWISPSPALPSAGQTYLYSLLGPLESLNLSVGRGINNDHAFEYFGAPWINNLDQITLLNNLKALNLKAVQFDKICWDVTRGIYNGQQACGFRAQLHDFKKLRDQSAYATYQIIKTLFQTFPTRLQNDGRLARFLGNQKIVSHVIGQDSWSTVESLYQRDYQHFQSLINNYLLYP